MFDQRQTPLVKLRALRISDAPESDAGALLLSAPLGNRTRCPVRA